MKRNFSAPIRDIKGAPILTMEEQGPDGEGKAQPPKQVPATLAFASFAALTMPLRGDEAMGAEQKLRLYALTQKVHAGGVVDVSAEDIALLKERIGRAHGVLVVGRAYELLEADLSEPAA